METNLLKKRVIWFTDYKPSLREDEVGTEVETRAERSSLSCFLWLAPLPFSYSQTYVTMDCGHGQGLLTPISSSPRHAHNQSEGGNSSVEFPLLRYVKVTADDRDYLERGRGTNRRGVSEGNEVQSE